MPIEPPTMKDGAVIEWHKDNIDTLKFMKVDPLDQYKGIRLDLATIPPEDPRTYAMICKADTIGVLQVKLRLQMAVNRHPIGALTYT